MDSFDPSINFKACNDLTENVDPFNYLGSVISADGGTF